MLSLWQNLHNESPSNQSPSSLKERLYQTWISYPIREALIKYTRMQQAGQGDAIAVQKLMTSML